MQLTQDDFLSKINYIQVPSLLQYFILFVFIINRILHSSLNLKKYFLNKQGFI